MSLIQDCEAIAAEVLETVKKNGAGNIQRQNEDFDDYADRMEIGQDVRSQARKLADESLQFAPNRQTAMLYSYAHYVKKLGSGRCQGQSCLAATMLLAKKYDCCTAIVEMSATDQHMFVIAANRDTFRTGSEVANLSPHPIIDCWLVLKLRSVGTVVKSGVFAARNHAAYLQKLEYSTKLDSVQRFTSPFE